MWITLLLAVFVGTLIAAIFGFWLLRVLPAATVKTLQSTATSLLEQSKQQLALERQQGVHDLDERRTAVENTVKNLEGQLLRYETLMKHFETDRDQKFGALKTELDRTLRANEQLQHTTSSLVAVLGNSRVRGQWGQKMAEDILRFCGLQEGIHYRREQGMSSGRPDYTFLLPDQHELYMDVKFPLERYLKAMESQDSASQQMHREAFLRDVKEHLREMERRGYQSSSEQGVDYLLIFIPNEQVYGLVNEWMPSLIDECLQKQMILCGPWTLYAVLRIVWQAWQNYHYTHAIGEVVKSIHDFLQDYSKFKDRFAELGSALTKATEYYQDISTKSYQRLDLRIKRIEAYRKGQHLSENLPPQEGIAISEPATTESHP